MNNKRYSLKEINSFMQSDPVSFVAECEQRYKNDIHRAADIIKERLPKCPVVLLSGPSGSGKTTSAIKIEKRLEQLGINSHTISMDNYFLSKGEYTPPLDDRGNDDLESPVCVDVELMRAHLQALAKGEEIYVPEFDFYTQKRSNRSHPIRLGKDEVVVIEGIHALNHSVVGNTGLYSTGIYVSMQNLPILNNGGIAPQSDMRVMRRIVRDSAFRARNPQKTISVWRSVSRGEHLYIFPHEENADIFIDSFIPYEGCVLAPIVNKLMQSCAELESNERTQRVMSIARIFHPVDSDIVPDDSVLREFIGNRAEK